MTQPTRVLFVARMELVMGRPLEMAENKWGNWGNKTPL